MFVVRFKGFGGDTLTDWKPNDDDDYICKKAVARFRFRRLVQAGQKGERVDGVVPWFVVLVDVSGPDKSESVKDVRRIDEAIQPDRRVRLVQYAERGSQAHGPWAHLALAS
jgi:hypothetical protein